MKCFSLPLKNGPIHGDLTLPDLNSPHLVFCVHTCQWQVQEHFYYTNNTISQLNRANLAHSHKLLLKGGRRKKKEGKLFNLIKKKVLLHELIEQMAIKVQHVKLTFNNSLRSLLIRENKIHKKLYK